MNYERVNWQDGINGNTPLNATNLNVMDKGIEEASNCINGSLPMGSIVVDDVSCKNRFDGLTELGSYSIAGGVPETSTTVRRNVNPISVTPNETIAISRNGIGLSSRIYYYDANKNFISTEAKTTGIYIIPSNCYYINFISDKILTDYTKLQVELGEVTSYTPHKKYGYNSQESMGKIVVDGIRSKNMFDKKKVTLSKIISRATGGTSTNASYSTTDYIPVSSGMKLKFTGFNQYYNAFYDKDKNYIGYTDVLNPMVVIDGAKYMRTSLLTANLDTAQIEEGEIATPHSEYIDFNNIISDVTNQFTINSEVATLNTNYTSKIYKSGNAVWLNLHLTLNTGITGTIENVVVGNLSTVIKPITPVFDRCLIGTSGYSGWNFDIPDGHVYINSEGKITIRNFTTTSSEKKYITINLVYFVG